MKKLLGKGTNKITRQFHGFRSSESVTKTEDNLEQVDICLLTVNEKKNSIFIWVNEGSHAP